MDEGGTRGTWGVKGRLLSDQPFKSHPSHADNLSNAFHQVLGDITAFHKTVVTFTFPVTLCLRCNTDCHYRHTLSSSTRSIELLLQNIFQVVASLSVSVHEFTHELMYRYYWCVTAAGMLTCFRYDMSCV